LISGVVLNCLPRRRRTGYGYYSYYDYAYYGKDGRDGVYGAKKGNGAPVLQDRRTKPAKVGGNGNGAEHEE
jgi:hypothetical protein